MNRKSLATYIKSIQLHCLHPYFYSLFAILFLYSHNIDQIEIVEIMAATVCVIFILAILIMVVDVVIKNREKTAILAFAFVIIFFSHGHVFDLIWGWEIGGILVGRNLYLLIFWIFLFCSVCIFVFLGKGSLKQANKIITVFTVVLLIVTSFNIGKHYIKNVLNKTGTSSAVEADQQNGRISAATQPDIYYLILDGYTSPRNLSTYYKFDDGAFVHYLQKKKFHVMEDGHSNYTTTFLSLLSSLNMKYMNTYFERYDADPRMPRQLAQMFEKNAVADFLKSKGYKIVHFSSGYSSTNYNKYADWNIYCGRLNEFNRMLIHTSLLRLVEDRISGNDSRHRILCTFEKIANVQKTISGPRFVFAHIVSPHAPYLFNAKGMPVDTTPLGLRPDGLEMWQLKEPYIEQVKFVNEKISQLVDKILAEANTPPIIIIQGDHGSASTGKWDTPSEALMQERLGIFNAFYLPENGGKDINEFLTPVNTFRFIFNKYFNTQNALLENRYYFSSYKNYRFLDVTSIITQSSHFKLKD